ncbi:MAG: NADP-dependent glyceraldehyde-3-phosphate dehydrogenase, partial [Flavisolibacter sp.]|nr:NADP-dependent glyceraldehyde-3-phosphate dehydrogenase [Flavisolibacter sp.]
MNFSDQLQSIFVSENEIPEQYCFTAPIHQREYLSNGELVHWDGNVHEVYSPVCIKTEKGLER